MTRKKPRACGAGGSPPDRPTRWPGCRSAFSSTGGWPGTTCVLPVRTLACSTGPACSTDDELNAMLKALDDLDRACANGSFRPTVADEDVHTALERGLLERLGALGGKLRAGRSRNDQVATDLRLYLRDNVRLIVSRLAELESALVDQAVASGDVPAPGMTHLQHAQPVLFGHRAARARPGVRPRRRAPAGLGQACRGQPARRRRAGRVIAARRSSGTGGRARLRLGRAELHGRGQRP